MPNDRNLWEEIGNKCLERANEVLDFPTFSPEMSAKTVNLLVETAISIDRLNLLWEQQARDCKSYFSRSK